MAIIIHEKTPGALISSAERTVATFESGLCRVDQVYTCTNDSAATHRASLTVGSTMPDGNSTPTIDGLYLFPSPQEINRQDGFTDFVVSAYGRTSKSPRNVVLNQTRVKVTNTNYGIFGVTGEICLRKNETLTLEMLEIDDLLYYPFDYRLDSFPDAFMLSIVELEGSRTKEISSSSTALLNQSDYAAKIVVYSEIRFFIIQMTYDGVTVADVLGTPLVVTIKIKSPTISITSTRSFGEFQELSFAVERENATTVIV